MNKVSSPDYRWIFVTQLYFGFAVWGIVQAFSQNSAVYVLFSLLVASSATMWVAFDSRYRYKPLPNIVLFLILLTWFIALPIYLIWTRKFSGLGWGIFHFIGLNLTLYLFFYLTFLAAYGPEAMAQ